METAEEDFEDLEILQFLSQRIINLWLTNRVFASPVVDTMRLKEFIQHKVSKELGSDQFRIVYFHTKVANKDNNPGILNLRWLYESLSKNAKERLQVVYLVHPGLLSRTIMGTLGRFFLSEGLYHKLVYVSRLEFLWDYLKQGQVEVPDFVLDHDKELKHFGAFVGKHMS
ncbi:hypothetical protein KP509_37G051300 [Ceratopteris richardii]|uniref:CRAL-TRIO domain-containing protein n=1 Tax=Ceratopteris richardii TaxID=49495 RepID=A0A8T2Q8U3_CERRI|nr:hypothetical protein KP509_37G051300 [Ceratopteris richardii]